MIWSHHFLHKYADFELKHLNIKSVGHTQQQHTFLTSHTQQAMSVGKQANSTVQLNNNHMMK